MDDAIWAAEKATLKAKFEWKETNALMKQLELKPQLLTFKAWLWAYATVSILFPGFEGCRACWSGPGIVVNGHDDGCKTKICVLGLNGV